MVHHRSLKIYVYVLNVISEYCTNLQQMGPKLVCRSTLRIPEEFHQFDDFLGTASVEENLALNIMEVKLKLVLVCPVQGDGHEAPRLQANSILITKVSNV